MGYDLSSEEYRRPGQSAALFVNREHLSKSGHPILVIKRVNLLPRSQRFHSRLRTWWCSQVRPGILTVEQVYLRKHVLR